MKPETGVVFLVLQLLGPDFDFPMPNFPIGLWGEVVGIVPSRARDWSASDHDRIFSENVVVGAGKGCYL